MDLDEILESPGFWILSALGVSATLLGWIFGRRAGWDAMPVWQLIVIIVVIIVASAFFAIRE